MHTTSNDHPTYLARTGDDPCAYAVDPYHYGHGWTHTACLLAAGHSGSHVGRDRSDTLSGFSHAVRIATRATRDASAPTTRARDASDWADIAPLHPLGATDSYTYANGVIAYYRGGYIYVHVDACTPPTSIPCHAWATIHAVAMSVGLSDTEASLLCEACESYGVTR